MPKTLSLTEAEARQLRIAIWTAIDMKEPETDIDILDDLLDRLTWHPAVTGTTDGKLFT